MLRKEVFLKKFKLEEAFRKSGLSCNCPEETDYNYCVKQDEIESCMNKKEQFVIVNVDALVYLIQFRYKNPEYLFEKIIRKKGEKQIWRYHKYTPRTVHRSRWELNFSRISGLTYITLWKSENSYVL